MGLSAKHLAFCNALANEPDFEPGKPSRGVGGRAYARVYGRKESKSTYDAAWKLLQRTEVATEVDRLYAAKVEAAGITAEQVVREVTLLAQADPRGLFEIHRGACRYCFGANHLYQRTPREHRVALADYIAKNKAKDPCGVFFDHAGGIGFNANRKPNPDCPECFGRGDVYEYIKDSRTWTPGAAKLFAGVERTRDGLKVKLRSQDRAVTLAAQMRGLLRAPDGEDEDDTPPPSQVIYEAQDASRPGRKR